jgi:hypothetical protein
MCFLCHGEIVIKPITDDYIRKMAGMAGTKGKLLKALMEEKTKQRNVESGDREKTPNPFSLPRAHRGIPSPAADFRSCSAKF